MTTHENACVLVVEDDDDLRTTIADLLRQERVDVAEAANGIEALAWMHGHAHPVLILLDVMMPRMDGVEFRKAQLAEPDLAGIPVVLMTASTVHQPLLEACGVDEIVRKPVELEKLVSVLHRYA